MVHKQDKKVALVLSSGGARGYAHIGAISELERQGFEVTSVAGTSMGALVGGMYAAGHLQEVSRWLKSLTMWQVLSLADLTLSRTHLANPDRVLETLKQIVPDVRIENLPIPYCAVAADIKNQKEVVFDHGSLYEAIRASISLPSFFKPVMGRGSVLMDGGLVNPLPLNRVKRYEGDLLAAVNVNAPVSAQVEALRQRAERMSMQEHNNLVQRYLPSVQSLENNHISLLSDAFSMSIVQLTQLALERQKPDILVEVPVNRFDAGYDEAERIIRYGQRKTREALTAYRLLSHEMSFAGTNAPASPKEQ